MYAFEIGLIIAMAIICYSFVRIKQVLRAKGRRVSYLAGWMADYRRFVKLIASEEDPQTRNKYNAIMLALHAGFIMLILIAGIGAFMY